MNELNWNIISVRLPSRSEPAVRLPSRSEPAGPVMVSVLTVSFPDGPSLVFLPTSIMHMDEWRWLADRQGAHRLFSTVKERRGEMEVVRRARQALDEVKRIVVEMAVGQISPDVRKIQVMSREGEQICSLSMFTRPPGFRFEGKEIVWPAGLRVEIVDQSAVRIGTFHLMDVKEAATRVVEAIRGGGITIFQKTEQGHGRRKPGKPDGRDVIAIVNDEIASDILYLHKVTQQELELRDRVSSDDLRSITDESRQNLALLLQKWRADMVGMGERGLAPDPVDIEVRDRDNVIVDERRISLTDALPAVDPDHPHGFIFDLLGEPAPPVAGVFLDDTRNPIEPGYIRGVFAVGLLGRPDFVSYPETKGWRWNFRKKGRE